MNLKQCYLMLLLIWSGIVLHIIMYELLKASYVLHVVLNK